MGYGVPTVWYDREKPIVDAIVQALGAGGYSTVTSAARSCFDQLTTLRRQAPEAQSPQAPATLQGVYSYLHRTTRGLRHHGPETFWTEDEDRVLGPYVEGLVHGRYRSAGAAARECVQEFERLRLAQQEVGWSKAPRMLSAVRVRITKLAQAAGRGRWRVHYSKEEVETFNRYARAVAEGRYHDLSPAAESCLNDLSRLRKRQGQAAPPLRPFNNVRNQISLRAQKLGWSWIAQRWRPDEKAIIDRYVRAVIDGAEPSVNQATRDCRAELDALYRQLGAGSYKRRTPATIRTYLARWSRREGRRIRDVWSEQENEIAGRFARALLDGKYPDAPAAARDCLREVMRLRRRWRAEQPARYRETRPRTLEAAYSHVCRLAHRPKQPWPKTRWTEAEMKICRRWIRWYDRHRGIRRLSPSNTVALGLQEEIERLGSRRTLTACRAWFWKEWRRQHGM